MALTGVRSGIVRRGGPAFVILAALALVVRLAGLWPLGSTPTTGTLRVIMSPSAGPSGTVTVSGPGGFHRSVTASTTFRSLHPGTYELDATPASVPYAKWWPQNPKLEAVVQAGRTTTASDEYSVEVPSTTKVLAADALPSQPTLQASAPGSVLLTPAQAATLAPGDVLVAAAGPVDPEGLLRKVVALSSSGAYVQVQTVAATVVDAVPTGSFDLQFSPVGAASSATTAAADTGADRRTYLDAYQPPRAGSENPVLLAGSSSPQLQFSLKPLDYPCGLFGTGTGTSASQVEQQLQTNLRVIPSPDFSVRWVNKRGIEATFAVTLSDQYQISARASVGVTCGKQIHIPARAVPVGPPVHVQLGPIPLVVQPQYDFVVQLTGYMTSGAAWGFRQQASLKLGMTSTPSGETPIASFHNRFTPLTPKLAETNVTAAVGPQLTLAIDGIGGPYLSLQLFGAGDISKSTTAHTGQVTATLTAGIRAGVGIKLTLFGFTNLDAGIPNLLQVSKQIYKNTQSYSPPSVSRPGTSVTTRPVLPSSPPVTGSTPSGFATPQAAVTGFFQGLMQGNYYDACSYMLPGQQSLCAAFIGSEGPVSGKWSFGSSVVDGTEALVVVVGQLCGRMNGSTYQCLTNPDPTYGLPTNGESFATAYSAALSSSNNNWDVPLEEVNGSWYVNGGV